MTPTAKQLEDSLLLVWNNRDEASRLEEMKRIYAPEIRFYENHSGDAVIGHTSINELISKLQKEWPAVFEFELSKPSRVNHTVQIISWNLGPKGATPVAAGIDLAIVQHEVIQELYLFLETN